MIDALIHLLIFFVETVILVAAILIIISGIVAIASKNKAAATGKVKVKKLSKHFEQLAKTLNEQVLSKKAFKKLAKREKKAQKKASIEKKNIFVIDFDGDIKAKQVNNLREEITAILMVAKPGDEVLLRLESAGGMMHAYGLAASQLQRLVDAKLPLTVAIDKVAASGGYLMACVANKIISAPFAILGSIGVVAQLPNFYRFLQSKNIDFEQITAGQYKRTMTLFAENTDADREKMQSEINDAHKLFKDFVITHRPNLDIDQVATGEHWFATEAKTFGLVDKLSTSDDYLLSQHKTAAIYQISFCEPKKLSQKLAALSQASFEKVYSLVWKQQSHSKLNL